ncbi:MULTISPECIES: DUF7577 domain-containing protein [Saliphagus]|uniref:DUF7577 domain-containing protein n=1 Tax=Saliphagus infecundisoli TaxID=1849069 RepID=A0ABD5QGR4_9EURY|nr:MULTISPECIES: hypothetical protein [Saliphagus]
MELWGWIAGYAVLFALLQAVLYYRYVYRGDGPSTALPEAGAADRGSPPVEGSAPGDDREPEPEPDDGETMHCPHCGGPNEIDPSFTYCRHCVSSLRR